MSKYPDQLELRHINNKVTNGALLVGILLGFSTFFISLLNFRTISFKLGFYLDFAILAIYTALYITRNRTSLTFKSAGILLGILVLAYTGIYRNGIYSGNKVLLVLIPFFLIFIFSVRQTAIIFLVMMAGLAYLGVLYVRGTLEPVMPYDVRGNSPTTWFMDILLLILLTSVVFVLQSQYIKTFLNMLKSLKRQNNELEGYRDSLEEKVKEKTLDLEQANEELNSTLNHLKDAQAQLIQAEKMASLGTLTAGVAHEINNPLNFIMGGYAGIGRYLEEKGGIRDDENLQFYMESISTGLSRVTEIVQGLTHYSRQTEQLNEKCNIHEILDNNLSMINNQIKYRVTLDKKYTTDEMVALGNVGKLHQAFLNILVNASQAIDGDGGITLSTWRESDRLSVEISDTGSGISEEDIPKITDPFFTTKEPGEGTGLGLSITSAIIREHKGNLAIESTPGKGTTVRIQLPAINTSFHSIAV